MNRDFDTLEDIQSAARKALAFLGEMEEGAFYDDEKTQAACMRQLEIIGEAVKRLTIETRNKKPEIPWKEWAGIRDVLIHAYDRVDLKEVWNTVKQDVPKLTSLVPESRDECS